MKKFRYTEIFYSIQGEGKYVGTPSVFLRLFGCNFKCQGFGMPQSKQSNEYLNINPKKYTDLKNMPLVTTGCDSYASWDPRCKHLTRQGTIDEIVDILINATPNGKWLQDDGQEIHLVITGGEPLLGWQKLYPELFNHNKMKDLKNVTFETNGTQLLHSNFKDYLTNKKDLQITWSCSPKLSISGERWDAAIKPKVVLDYYSIHNSNLYFKFVVSNEMDFREVGRAFKEYQASGIAAPIYCMPCGGLEAEYLANAKKVAELSLKHGYKYSPRLHTDLFSNNWGT